MNQAAVEIEEELYSARDYVAIIKRRRRPFLLTFLAVAVLSIILALTLPATYTSQATILIEEQEVPREFVISTITSFAAQQIQVISQRVLTAENIAGIADKFGLFVDPSTNRRPPATKIAQRFRDIMKLNLVSADVIDPRSGRAQEATIAFTLAFDHQDPKTAQKVTNELVTLFLDENLRNRTDRAASTETFLAAQADRLDEELARIEGEISAIKTQDGAALPEMFQYNIRTLERTTAELSDVDRRLRELARTKTEITAQLGLTNSVAERSTTTGEELLSIRGQIAALKREYEQKSTRYKELHPDLMAAKRQIEALTAKLENNESDALGAGSASNPSYILLKTRLDTAIGEEAGLREKRKELEAKFERFEEIISRAPGVEVIYNSKQREFDTAQRKYQEVRAKQREAELTGNMEQARKGERFVIVEQPDLPIDPSKPNRPIIGAIGLIFALGAALGLALLLEALDTAIHDARMLTRITGAPPFATIGYISTTAETRGQTGSRRRTLYAFLIGALILVALVHFIIMPLDILWFALLDKLGV